MSTSARQLCQFLRKQRMNKVGTLPSPSDLQSRCLSRSIFLVFSFSFSSIISVRINRLHFLILRKKNTLLSCKENLATSSLNFLSFCSHRQPSPGGTFFFSERWLCHQQQPNCQMTPSFLWCVISPGAQLSRVLCWGP